MQCGLFLYGTCLFDIRAVGLKITHETAARGFGFDVGVGHTAQTNGKDDPQTFFHTNTSQKQIKLLKECMHREGTHKGHFR